MTDSNLPINPDFKADNKLVSNGTRQDIVRRDRTWRKMMKKVKSLKLDELKKHGDDLYEISLLRETALVEAYNDKRLKSKKLVKKAKKIIKRREEEAKKKVE